MRKKIVTKQDLQKYAAEIIKDHGLDECTMRNLAAKSGIAVGTLYNYYPSREKLLNDVFTASWAETISKLKRILDTDLNPEEKIAEYCNTIFDEINDRNGLGKEVVVNDANLLSGTSPYYDLLNELVTLLKSIIVQSQNNKDLPEATLLMLSKWVLLAIISHIPNNHENREIFIDQLCIRFL